MAEPNFTFNYNASTDFWQSIGGDVRAQIVSSEVIKINDKYIPLEIIYASAFIC